jgi:hypothetical protein
MNCHPPFSHEEGAFSFEEENSTGVSGFMEQYRVIQCDSKEYQRCIV